jgi:hypothetical protein
MKLKPLTTRFIQDSHEFTQVLNDLIETSESIFISSAWVSDKSDSYKLLYKNRQKITTFYCGISGFNTTPQVLKDYALPFKNFWIVNDVNLFHHKCFIFKIKDRKGLFKHKVLMGSANFTYAGLYENYEILQLTEFDGLIDLEDKITSSLKPVAIQYDLNDILDYERRYLELQNLKRKQDELLEQSKHPFGGLSFEQYQDCYKGYSKMNERIELLDQLQMLLANYPFHELDLIDRKKISGLYQGKDNGIVDSRWFGSMRRATHFFEKVEKDAKAISSAISLLPKKGQAITKLDYEKFCEAMISASGYSEDPIGIVTRMLAMIRPDYFLCITTQNKHEIAKDFRLKSNTLSLTNYWDLIIEPLIKSPWWQSPRPEGLAGKLWDYRVAMLDCLYYVPHKASEDVWEKKKE